MADSAPQNEEGAGSWGILPILVLTVLPLIATAGLIVATDMSPLGLIVAVIVVNTIALQVVRLAVTSRASR